MKRTLNLLVLIALLALAFNAQGVDSAQADDSCLPNEDCGSSSSVSVASISPNLPIVDVISNLSAPQVSGYGANVPYTLAAGFTTNADLYQVNSVSLLMRNATGTNYTVSAWLYSDNAGNPGSLLATFNPFVISSSTYSVYTMNLPAPYALSPSTTYWIVVTSDYPSTGGVFWRYSSTAPTGIFTYAGNRENNNNGGWVSAGRDFMWSLQAELVAPNTASNLLKKPDFASASIFPTPWQLFGVKPPYASALDCAVFQVASCSVYFPSGNRSAMQRVLRSGLAGDMYQFGLSSMAQNAGGKYLVEATFYNNYNRPVGTASASFTPGTHGWETVGGFATATGNYNRIVFRFYYQNATGRAWFDDAFLIVAP